MPLAQRWGKTGGAVWDRVRWLDHELRAGRKPTKRQLQARFAIAESCATQTIAFMKRQLQLPLVFDRSAGGYVYRGDAPLAPGGHPGLLATREELAALRLVSHLAVQHLDAETCGQLEALTTRVLTASDAGLAREYERWEHDVVFTGPPPLRRPHLRRIKAAIESRRVLHLDYQVGGELMAREVEPHLLINAGGDWLLAAWDRDRAGVRTFALARIQWCEPTDERFSRRSELVSERFTQNHFLSEGGGAPYELVVRFDGRVSQVASERKWHPSQQTRTAQDGRLELTLTVSGVGDVLRWLLGFGGAVEVVSPAWMRQQVYEEAHAAAERHR
ncbi:MAG: helix-turn-helix transcriptional regulator [Actinomycetota bacterium]